MSAKFPEDWAIRHILHNYSSAVRRNDEAGLNVNDQFNNEKLIDSNYIQAMRLVFAFDRYSYADMFTVEDFVENVKEGWFNRYDGSGIYVSWTGQSLGPFSFTFPNDHPENAVFVAWYNK